jgi:hypothetical protein
MTCNIQRTVWQYWSILIKQLRSPPSGGSHCLNTRYLPACEARRNRIHVASLVCRDNSNSPILGEFGRPENVLFVVGLQYKSPSISNSPCCMGSPESQDTSNLRHRSEPFRITIHALRGNSPGSFGVFICGPCHNVVKLH